MPLSLLHRTFLLGIYLLAAYAKKETPVIASRKNRKKILFFLFTRADTLYKSWYNQYPPCAVINNNA
ncbi:MAG: hypothetical protein QM737_15770 [Ferruginibacter sp.]